MNKLLNSGIIPLTDGLSKISDGAKELSSGTSTLDDGAKELRDGISKYNKEGISKISDLINNDLKNLEVRAKKLEELSKDYNKFKDNEERDRISFISSVDSITKNEDETEN